MRWPKTIVEPGLEKPCQGGKIIRARIMPKFIKAVEFVISAKKNFDCTKGMSQHMLFRHQEREGSHRVERKLRDAVLYVKKPQIQL